MKHFGKNRFISFFALLLVLTLALSMNSVFAADTAATGTESAVQQESGESPASKGSNSAVSEQNPEQNQEQKPENSASPENLTTPESPKNLGWVSDNNETRYYDTENHFVTGMNTIEGKKYYFNNDGILQRGILKIGKAYYYADGKGVIRTAKGFVSCSGRLYYVQNGGQILAGKTFKLGKKPTGQPETVSLCGACTNGESITTTPIPKASSARRKVVSAGRATPIIAIKAENSPPRRW